MLTGHCVSSCHSVMGTSFSCRADGKRTGGERNRQKEVEMERQRNRHKQRQRKWEGVTVKKKQNNKQRNKTEKEKLFFSEFTMHLLCDQTLVMWREKLNAFLMMLGTSAALKICCTYVFFFVSQGSLMHQKR